jgi:hypothetical protein
MSLTIVISNFRGCARAQLDCAPVALLAGQNAAGKSSIAQAAGAALSGTTLFAGLRASNAGALVRLGADSGSVEVSTEDGSAGVQWPSATKVTRGSAPEASVYAVGIESVVTMQPKDRLRVLADYLGADPTRDDLSAAIAETGLDAERVTATIWGLIEQHGWDGALSLRRERGAQMKGQWHQITGANYGSSKAASWRPDLAELVEADLLAAVSNAQMARDRALTAEAVSDAERHRLEGEADLYDARLAAFERASARVSENHLALQKAQGARAALPLASRRDGLPCPWCERPVMIVDNPPVRSLERGEVGDLERPELDRRRMAIAEADGKLSHASGDLNQARRDVAAGEKAVRDSLEARERLDKWPRAVETGTGDIATAAAQLGRAEKRLAEYREKLQADEVHARIEGNELVMAILAPDGLRAKKLGSRMEAFHEQLAELASAAGWHGVRVDSAGNIFYSGRPYALLSSSEQYRVRALLAAAMADIDGSDVVIFDGADILDAPSRAGLFALIARLGVPALVCMTLARRDQVPDLDAAGVGRSYWLSGGNVEPLGEKVAA